MTLGVSFPRARHTHLRLMTGMEYCYRQQYQWLAGLSLEVACILLSLS